LRFDPEDTKYFLKNKILPRVKQIGSNLRIENAPNPIHVFSPNLGNRSCTVPSAHFTGGDIRDFIDD